MRKFIACLVFLFPLLVLNAESDTKGPVFLLNVEGVINPVISSYVEDGLNAAEKEGAEAVLIEMNTPGGLLDATRSIIGQIINSKLPVIVYVSPRGSRATSAGVFIMMGSDVAAMAPETHLGAAHPVTISGDGGPPSKKPEAKEEKAKEDQPGLAMSEKMVSDAAAYIRTLAKQRGRNAEWAERAVRESVSLTSEEALKENVIDVIAANREELFKKCDGRIIEKNGKKLKLNLGEASVTFYPLSGIKKILHMIAHPNVAYILMTIGIYGLIYELASPGIGLGGGVGVICLLLAFFSLQILPINAVGVALIIVGMVLLSLELITPSHGLLSFGGLISFALGSFMLIDIKTNPAYSRVSIELILSTVGVTAFFFGFAVKKAWRARKTRPTTGIESMVGSTAIARVDLSPEGLVFMDGELWSACAEEPVSKNEEVVVQEVRGNKLIVKKKSKETL